MNAPAETIREIYAALARGDAGPLADLMHEEIAWEEPEGSPVISGAYAGRRAVLEHVLTRTAEIWETFDVHPEEFFVDRQTVIVVGRLEVVGRGTGGRASAPFTHIWDLRDGRLMRWRCMTDTALLRLARTSR